MRRGREGSVWRDDSGKVIALNLGSDYCAEHEWGIKGLAGILGILGPDEIDLKMSTLNKIKDFLNLRKPSRAGMDTRLMTTDYSPVHNLETDGFSLTSGYGKQKKKHTMWAFAVVSGWKKEYFDFKNIIENYYAPEKEELVGHWSEGDLCVFIEDRSIVEEFIEAFKRKDICLWLGGGGAFKNAGLVIAIASRIPEDFKQDALDTDTDQFELMKTAAATGIHEILKKADCRYYALSPRWKDESKKEVIFWLNPMDQHINESGWYKVDELKLWAKGEGKIIKKAEV